MNNYAMATKASFEAAKTTASSEAQKSEALGPEKAKQKPKPHAADRNVPNEKQPGNSGLNVNLELVGSTMDHDAKLPRQGSLRYKPEKHSLV